MSKLVTLAGDLKKSPVDLVKPLFYAGLGVLIYLMMKEKR